MTASAEAPSVETYQRPPASHWLTRAVVMRGLGAIYVVAFAILVDEGPGLLGSQGITPAAEFLERLAAQPATDWTQELPTLFLWLGASDGMLRGAVWLGLAGGVAMALGELYRYAVAYDAGATAGAEPTRGDEHATAAHKVWWRRTRIGPVMPPIGFGTLPPRDVRR